MPKVLSFSKNVVMVKSLAISENREFASIREGAQSSSSRKALEPFASLKDDPRLRRKSALEFAPWCGVPKKATCRILESRSRHWLGLACAIRRASICQ